MFLYIKLFIVTSEPKYMGLATLIMICGCLLLKWLKKIVILKMAAADFYINVFPQNFPRVPEWHLSEYHIGLFDEHKNAKQLCRLQCKSVPDYM